MILSTVVPEPEHTLGSSPTKHMLQLRAAACTL